MRRFRLAAATVPLAALLSLAGCASHHASKPVATGPAPRVYAIDLAGKAALCKPGKVTPKPHGTVAADMTVGSAGGWCGLSVQRHGAPFAAGLLTRRAAHGRVYIHTVGAATRIDYTPAPGFVGQDRFAVELLPDHARLNVAVTVRP
ncbi:MAG: Ig-like domain-containing protein [Acetobacteraceae bacterium]